MSRRRKRKRRQYQGSNSIRVPEEVHITRDMFTAADNEPPIPAIARQANHFSPDRCRDIVCAMPIEHDGVTEVRVVAGITLPCDSPFSLRVVAGDYQTYFARNDPRVLLRKEYMYLLAHPDETENFFQGCSYDEIGVLEDFIHNHAF